MAFNIEIKGTDKLEKALENKAKADLIRQAVKMNGSELLRNAQRSTPVDTGNLRRSSSLRIEDGGLSARVGYTAEYAPYVEYGTRFMNAQPYLKPAFQSQNRKFENDLKKIMAKE